MDSIYYITCISHTPLTAVAAAETLAARTTTVPYKFIQGTLYSSTSSIAGEMAGVQ